MYGQISYWAFQDGLSGKRSVMDAMKLAKEMGFEGIELCISGEGDITPDTTSDQCRQIANAAKGLGLRLGSVASGLLWDANPAAPDKATRDRAVETTRKCLRVTADLGAKFLLVLPGHVDVFFKPEAIVVPYDDCYKRALAFGKAVSKTAAKLGVYACFENVWNKFLTSPLEFKRFLAEIKSPAAGAYFDVGNVWNFGYPQHWIKILGRAIKAVHVKDFKRSVGNVSGFCHLLEGDVPLAESLAILRKQGYKGSVTAEVFPRPGQNEAEFLRATSQNLKKIMAG